MDRPGHPVHGRGAEDHSDPRPHALRLSVLVKKEFANPDYPKYVAAYAAAFAERYKGIVKWYTPLNEPIINALMCGMRGLWPPYLKGDNGYIRMMLQLARGIIQTVKAIKADRSRRGDGPCRGDRL